MAIYSNGKGQHVNSPLNIRRQYEFVTVTSQWVRWRLKSPASPLFAQLLVQAQIKENIKAPRHWPLSGEFTGDFWVPRTKGNAENVSIWWRHHGNHLGGGGGGGRSWGWGRHLSCYPCFVFCCSDLSSNRISHIAAYAFNRTSTSDLYFSGNFLREIESHGFHGSSHK